MKIAVFGSKGYFDIEFVQSVLNDYLATMSVFLSNGTKGVESYAENWIDEYNKVVIKEEPKLVITKLIIEKNNKLIIKEADCIVVFFNGKSKETKNLINLAIKYNKDVDIYVRK